MAGSKAWATRVDSSIVFFYSDIPRSANPH